MFSIGALKGISQPVLSTNGEDPALSIQARASRYTSADLAPKTIWVWSTFPMRAIELASAEGRSQKRSLPTSVRVCDA